MSNQIVRVLLAAVALLMALTGCSRKDADPQADLQKRDGQVQAAARRAGRDFVILATTDLRDVQPLEQLALRATGVRLKFVFSSTMESTEAVLTGKTNASAAWFANAKYLLSDPAGQARVKLQEKIMFSPLAIGVSESDAQALGWDRPEVASKVTWKTITSAARDGKLHFAMSNPATSNQGFMALMGVVAAAADKADALTADDVDRGAIAAFLKGYRLVGDNSSDLFRQFMSEQGPRLNGFINYESLLMSFNASGKLREKLTIVRPNQGVSTADYPLMLLDDSRRDEYLRLVEWLKGPQAQEWLARETLRRPVNAEVASRLTEVLPDTGTLVELPFSPDRRLANGLIESYRNEFRRPIASTFVLDVSGSMRKDGRLQQMQKAIGYIAGDDASLTGRVARLTDREKIWLMSFSDHPNQPVLFEIPAAKPRTKGVATMADTQAKTAVLDGVRQFVDGLRADGETALFDSVLLALQNMAAERASHPEYQYSVVALTDGMNSVGTFDSFVERYRTQPEAVKSIPVFMILYGDARVEELQSLVSVTGGKVFDATKTPLFSVFKEIRAYQ